MEALVAESLEDVDPKRRRVLDGATQAFLAYGYSRTTMDDIARAADMSRPALYLLFRNKSEIFRAIAAAILETALAKATRALRTDAPLGDRLMRMVDDCHIAMMRVVAASPHASEILDMKGTLVGDLADGWRRRLAGHLARAIEMEAGRCAATLADRGLSGQALAEMLLDGLHGLAERSPDPDSQRRGAAALVAIIEIVLGCSGPTREHGLRRRSGTAPH